MQSFVLTNPKNDKQFTCSLNCEEAEKEDARQLGYARRRLFWISLARNFVSLESFECPSQE